MKSLAVERPNRAIVWLLVVLSGLAVVVAGRAAGTPKLIESAAMTATAPQIAAEAAPNETPRPRERIDPPSATAAPSATLTATATETATAAESPTRTPRPTATPRPDAPEPDDPAVSQVYNRGTSGRPEIALTFDAGADRGYAEEILDTLDRYGIKASFGISGRWAQENPDLVKRMVKEGHMVVNHTKSHHSFLADSPSDPETITDPDAQTKELDDTATRISKVTKGYDVRPYWRPPYGEYDDAVLANVAADGYTATVMWSCDTLGWNGASVDEIVARCGSDAQPGDIILMHVGAASLDAEALPRLIETLQALGYEMVTIEQLLQP